MNLKEEWEIGYVSISCVIGTLSYNVAVYIYLKSISLIWRNNDAKDRDFSGYEFAIATQLPSRGESFKFACSTLPVECTHGERCTDISFHFYSQSEGCVRFPLRVLATFLPTLLFHRHRTTRSSERNKRFQFVFPIFRRTRQALLSLT